MQPMTDAAFAVERITDNVIKSRILLFPLPENCIGNQIRELN